MRRNARRNRPRDGFTLMELLLVMGILVILLGMVVPRLLGSQKKANINAAKAQIGLFKLPLSTYALDLNNYPVTDQGLAALYELPSDLENETKWSGPYIDSRVPVDPWGNEYQYEYPPTRNENDMPDIWSMGPDGEDGTDDDIVNWYEDDDSEA